MGTPYFKKPKGKTIDEVITEELERRQREGYPEHEVRLVLERQVAFLDENNSWRREVAVEFRANRNSYILRPEDLAEINPDTLIRATQITVETEGIIKRLGDTAVYKAARKKAGSPTAVSNRKTNKESENKETKQQGKRGCQEFCVTEFSFSPGISILPSKSIAI